MSFGDVFQNALLYFCQRQILPSSSGAVYSMLISGRDAALKNGSMLDRLGGFGVEVRSFDKLFVDGQWLDSTGSGRIEVVSPHTEQVIASAPDGTAGDMDRAVAAARRAFDQGAWPRLAPKERIAAAFRRRQSEVAEVVSAENGCPITLSTHLQAAGPLAIVESFLTVAKEFRWESQRPGATHGSVTVRRE